MKIYDVRSCLCGRLHVIPQEKIQSALKENGELLLVCGGCGAVTVIGGEYRPEGAYGFTKPCYDMYSYDITSTFSIKSDFTTPKNGKLFEILFDKGIRIPMMSGEYANQYSPYFGFADSSMPSLDKVNTSQDAKAFIEKYSRDGQTVNMNRLINENDDEVLRAISAKMFNGLDWAGTPYDNWWLEQYAATEFFDNK